jgi:hypothetical protein
MAPKVAHITVRLLCGSSAGAPAFAWKTFCAACGEDSTRGELAAAGAAVPPAPIGCSSSEAALGAAGTERRPAPRRPVRLPAGVRAFPARPA